MVFWDTTSTYFEGNGPAELGDYGYSKDHRPDRIQVMIGVVMTRSGIPIAHEVTSVQIALKFAFSLIRVAN